MSSGRPRGGAGKHKTTTTPRHYDPIGFAGTMDKFVRRLARAGVLQCRQAACFGSNPRGAFACFGVCVDLCRVVHLLAGPPWRPNGRQGSGFDSPWQGGGGTTSLRAPAVAKLLFQRGGLGVK